MECRFAAALAPAYGDGELDDERRRWFEAHLPGCPACARALAEQHALGAAIRAHASRHRAPPGLAGRIARSVAAVDGVGRPERRLALAAMVAGIAVLSAGGTWVALRRDPVAEAANEMVAAHVHGLTRTPPVEVASNDRHEVKPWFAGRVDVAPPTVDLGAAGFILLGGRVDHVDRDRVPVLVYALRRHLISLYVRRADGAAAAAPERLAIRGFSVVRWTADGLRFWAVSDVNADDLDRFAALYRADARAPG